MIKIFEIEEFRGDFVFSGTSPGVFWLSTCRFLIKWFLIKQKLRVLLHRIGDVHSTDDDIQL